MHKKLASDLTSLAHSILQMKNKEDVFELKQKAYEVYEKLSVLAYVEEYINNTPNPLKSKEELLQDIVLAEEKQQEEVLAKNLSVKEIVVPDAKEEITEVVEEEVKEAVQELNVEKSIEEPIEKDRVVHHLEEALKEELEQEADEIADKIIEAIEEETIIEEIIEQPFDELEELLHGDSDVKNDVKDVGERKTPTLEDELQDTISVDVMTDLFTKVEPKKTVNDYFQKTIQIDLNDRIAFVKHLFDGDQNDFNRVISQLNTFKTEKEAKKFITKMIKPDYDWSAKEEYENRLLEIIERRFA
ncbi:hypothetical protein [Tenacibaculum sp. L6]|uniref:hypothetical protein n=1 Tax=Tenacibaculum sp. L6 TaxID=2992764 RepID=UPI00237BB47E|nr:hypothetical protein [Tenacibaculum sp. L6]MDE0536832.1 hypothetical protein [Tenacibaculum sp. L6]